MNTQALNIGRAHLIGAFMMVVVTCGCATAPPEPQEKTSQTLTELTQAMTAARSQIDKALVSLSALTTAPAGVTREAYDRFTKDVSAISREANRIQRQSREMKETSAEWLSAWQKSYNEIQNPELRQVSEQRRAAVISRFDTVNASLEAANQTLVPFVKRFQDVNRVIGNDLTPKGIAAISPTPTVQNANAHGREAARALDVAIVDLQSLNSALSTAVE